MIDIIVRKNGKLLLLATKVEIKALKKVAKKQHCKLPEIKPYRFHSWRDYILFVLEEKKWI